MVNRVHIDREKTMRWTTEKRKISDLLPMDCNPRQMTEKQAKELFRHLEQLQQRSSRTAGEWRARFDALVTSRQAGK